MASIDLIKAIGEATPKPLSAGAPVPDPLRRVLAHAFTPEALEHLARRPKRIRGGRGKGGNTNYAESVLTRYFRRAGKVKFHPNGSQRPPDAVIGDCEFEWKSAWLLSANFAFNDSVPQGGRYYCFYARNARRALVIPGDVLVLGMNEEVIVRIHEDIARAREAGKDDGLCFFYPRTNMFVRNFLKYAKANGYFDYDRGVIWTP
jgi:hypothetical protein